MGASPTPMAFGEVYTSLQTGVIDGYEHDASTTLQQRFFEVARHMARTRHIAGVLGLFASTVGLARLPAGMRDAHRGGGARGLARSAGDGTAGGCRGDRPRSPPGACRSATSTRAFFRAAGRTAVDRRSARARRRGVAGGDPRVSELAHGATAPRSAFDRGLEWAVAILMVAQAAVVGLQVVAPSCGPPAVSVDGGDRPTPPRLADVRRRHRGAARRPASARDRARAPLQCAASAGRSIAASVSCCWRSCCGWSARPGG